MKLFSKGRTLHSREFHKERRDTRRSVRIAFLTFLLVFLVLFVYLSRLDQLRIKEVVVEGESAVQEEVIAGLASEVITGHYLWLVPRANALLFPRRALVRRLQSEIPRLKSVSVSMLDTHTIEILVSERAPLALYCQDAEATLVLTGCYFLDRSGYIFSIAPAFSGGVYFIYTKDVSMENPLGQYFLPTEEFAPLVSFLETLPSVGVTPRQFTVLGEGSERKYNVTLPNGGDIFWKGVESPAQVKSGLETLLLSPAVTADSSFLSRVLYIDLTVKNKVFYKLQD